MKRKEPVINEFYGELYTIKANYKIPNDCKYPLETIQTSFKQKQTNAEGLERCLNQALVQK